MNWTGHVVAAPRSDLAALLKGIARRGFAVGSGYGRLKETTFRIGHMGDHTVDGVRALLGAIDGVLAEEGR